MIRLIIAGPRSCTRNSVIFEQITKFINENGGVDEIITGGSFGVDMMAKQYAYEHQMVYREFLPNWQNDLNAASIIRDARMVENATHLLVFVHPATKESENLIREAESNHLMITRIMTSSLVSLPSLL